MFLPGHAGLRDRDLMDRADLRAGPASVVAVRQAPEMAGLEPRDGDQGQAARIAAFCAYQVLTDFPGKLTF